ncbi:MAG: glycosyltransferase [Acidobacteria bacterium]|nr:glycosyltransferase [Acidobacteriota bacterium]
MNNDGESRPVRDVESGSVADSAYARELEETLARYRLDLATERARTRRMLAEAFQREQALRSEMERLKSQLDETVVSTQQNGGSRLKMEQTIAELRNQLSAAHVAVQATRREVEAWKRAYDAAQEGIEHLRRELTKWSGSKFGRIASLYWRARGRLKRTVRSSREPALRKSGQDEADHHQGRDVPREAPTVVPGQGTLRRRREVKIPTGFPHEPRGRYDVVVLSIIDWDFRFQRPQQLAVQFGRHGHRVFYLSTSKFLKHNDVPARLDLKAENVVELKVRSRRSLNIYGGRLDEEDLETLETSFERLAVEMSMGDAVVMAQIPFWEPLAMRLGEKLGWKIVYDCMDEWTNFPGFGEDVLKLEEKLAREADLTVVSGETLVGKFDGKANRVLLAKNAVDMSHYKHYYAENRLLSDLEHPIIGYFGALASWADVPLLERIADTFPQAQIVLAGGIFDVDLGDLEKRPNVHLLGQRPYEEMPQLLWNYDVCMIPFQINDITHATNPVKLYEYFFSGKPVVAPALHELEPFQEECYLASNHEEFIDGLRLALNEPEDDPRRAKRRDVAAANDWSVRYQAIHETLVDGFPLVSVIVVTYGGLEHTRRCLESLEMETWPCLEIIVVDNNSPDETQAFLETYAETHENVRIILNRENRGFAAANNQGLEQASGEVLVLLNNDTVTPPGLMGRLVRHLLQEPSLGLLCPATNFCGNEARVEAGYKHLTDVPAYASWRGVTFAGKIFDLSVAAMYCVAIRRDVYEEVGPLDDHFGIGMFEDDDYSLRVRKAGYRVACADDAYVHHVGQATFAKLAPEEYQQLWDRNQAYFEEKWGRPWQPHKPRPGLT